MGNRINEALDAIREREHVTYREIAERCEVSEQTLHSARKRQSVDAIHVDVFLKIAHGLGMTAEELYYGKEYSASNEHPSISAGERRMLDVYRATDARGRENIECAVDREARFMDELAKNEARGA